MSEKIKEQLRKGEVLFLQGEEPKYLYYLHSGAVEILSCPTEYEGLDKDIIISKSKRVGTIGPNSLISGLSILFTEPYQKSIRAIEDSVVTKYPIKEGGFKQISQEDPALALNILTHLFKRFEISIQDATKYTKLYQNILKISDNIALVIRELVAQVNSENLQSIMDSLYDTYIANGGEFPPVVDSKFLLADNSTILKKNYNFPGLPLETLIDLRQASFFKKFLGLSNAMLESMIREKPDIAIYMFEIVSENLLKVLDRLEAVANEIDELLKIIFGIDSSWSWFLTDQQGYRKISANGRLERDFLKNLLSIFAKLNTVYQEISGQNMVEKYPGIRKLHSLYVSQKNEENQKPNEEKEQEIRITRISSSVLSYYRNSLHQIFEYSLAEKEFQTNFLKALNTFKNMKNPFDTEIEGRKIRRTLSRFYWDLYGKVFVMSKTKEAPYPARLMLHFGFIDETLMDEEQIPALHELLLRSAEKVRIPIYYEEEFLTLIYEGKVSPSINEMGLTYEQFLAEQGKAKTKEKEATTPDENINKVLYEIAHRIASTVSVCSGSTATAFPILTSLVMKGSPTSFHLSKKKIETTVLQLRDIDFSVFYRETVAKIGEAREVIEEEVIPNFIIIPSVGTKTMLWQDLEGPNRKSRGRIVIPAFFIGDLTRSMAHTFACFRYELNRSIKGAAWRDPVEGGLTGIYLDYVQFYKKNSKLSIEAKEKIAEKFRNIRDDRNRFADDYIQWVLYEKDGIPRLNTVVRDMFYRHIRFKKEIREKLQSTPIFSEIATRFHNVYSREIAQYERKFKKYRDASGNLPEVLQKFMDYLNM
ncbi:MAG: cyclic nucleotide-binding domain-containing protein [Spirochaetes bacterium]|nr:cyclic nucleotide-binding domain-containing protein [Spirochaetota bacterium]